MLEPRSVPASIERPSVWLGYWIRSIAALKGLGMHVSAALLTIGTAIIDGEEMTLSAGWRNLRVERKIRVRSVIGRCDATLIGLARPRGL